MGMYTGLRFEAKLKPFVADAIELVLSEQNLYSLWDPLAGIISIDQKWLDVGRKDFIPFGSMSYMPDDWVHRNDIYRFSQKWFVCCSLKNYEGEIESFLDLVLPFLIDEPCDVEVLYEEWPKPREQRIEPKPLEQTGI